MLWTYAYAAVLAQAAAASSRPCCVFMRMAGSWWSRCGVVGEVGDRGMKGGRGMKGAEAWVEA